MKEVESRDRSNCGSPAEPSVRSTRITTTSQDECLAWLQAAGLHVRQNQISRGPYVAEFELVTLSNGLRFSHSCYSAAMATRGAPPRGAYTFSLSDAVPEGVYFNQQPLGGSDIAVLRPGDEFFASRPARMSSLVVYADAGLVERRCEEVHSISAHAFLRGGSNIRADRAAVAACTRQFAQIAKRAVAGKLRIRDANRAMLLSEQLVDAVLETIEPPAQPRGWSGRQRVLDRAWALVEEDEGVASVGQLCARLGVPIRTVDDAFRAGMGLTPKRFILAVRLNQVRRLLSHPDAGTTVTDAATSLSFFHFGHFSSHYSNLFGETPSQTLRRARGGARTTPRQMRRVGAGLN
jgi:AraC family ethanolamine operon transcriptional activator